MYSASKSTVKSIWFCCYQLTSSRHGPHAFKTTNKHPNNSYEQARDCSPDSKYHTRNLSHTHTNTNKHAIHNHGQPQNHTHTHTQHTHTPTDTHTHKHTHTPTHPDKDTKHLARLIQFKLESWLHNCNLESHRIRMKLDTTELAPRHYPCNLNTQPKTAMSATTEFQTAVPKANRTNCPSITWQLSSCSSSTKLYRQRASLTNTLYTPAP